MKFLENVTRISISFYFLSIMLPVEIISLIYPYPHDTLGFINHRIIPTVSKRISMPIKYPQNKSAKTENYAST